MQTAAQKAKTLVAHAERNIAPTPAQTTANATASCVVTAPMPVGIGSAQSSSGAV